MVKLDYVNIRRKVLVDKQGQSMVQSGPINLKELDFSELPVDKFTQVLLIYRTNVFNFYN